MLRVLALGDAHFETKNIKEIEIFLDKLEKFIQSNEIDIICILGDTLNDHERIHVSPLNKAIKYVSLCSKYKKTYLLIGNHDMNNQSAFLNFEHWATCLKPYDNLVVVDDIITENINGHEIIFSPYVPEGKVIEALELKNKNWKNSKCIFAHWDIRGADMGSLIMKDADEWLNDYPFLVSGHIHLSQWLGPNMYYTGSIFQVAVNESSNKHISIIKIDNEIKIEEYSLNLPRKEIIDVNVCDIDDLLIPNEINVKYTLYINGSYEEFGAFKKTLKYKDLLKSEIKMRFKPTIKKIENKKVYENKKSFKELFYNSIENENDTFKSFCKYMIDNIGSDPTE